ncbi:MAG: sugar nucleotide-binding protein [Verrucomicrobiales bacterium]|nr:sugar nucleotide-binding protein [Verrucomicrobiales bacterium]
MILVTGARGLIGTRLSELYTKTDSAEPALVCADLLDGFDILDREALFSRAKEVMTPDSMIIHLAAFTDVSGAHNQDSDEGGLCYRLNVEGTRNVVDLANELGAHLVHFSTDFVFDGEKSAPYTEVDEPNPIEWYGKTKLIAEEVVRDNAGSWTIMRIAYPYHRVSGVRLDLVSTIRQKLSNGERLYLFGDQIITPTFADDIAQAAIKFSERRLKGEIFHVMGPASLSPHQLGARIAKLDGGDRSLITETSLEEYIKKDPRPRQKRLAMDTTKFRTFCQSTGIPLQRDLEEALGDCRFIPK